jgi:hypothetical protein
MRAKIAIGVLIGIIVGMLADNLTTPAEAQSPGTRVVLMGIHPTTGAAIPVSITTQGYVNTKVIP